MPVKKQMGVHQAAVEKVKTLALSIWLIRAQHCLVLKEQNIISFLS